MINEFIKNIDIFLGIGIFLLFLYLLALFLDKRAENKKKKQKQTDSLSNDPFINEWIRDTKHFQRLGNRNYITWADVINNEKNIIDSYDENLPEFDDKDWDNRPPD